jgi:predicted nucleic acid-binding protein
MIAVIADTGFLVALFRRNDRLRAAAREHLRKHTYPLVTVAPVIVETCFFLDPRGKSELLQWVQRGGLAVVEAPVEAYAEIEALILKYADHDIDFADAALIWFARTNNQRRILTVDEKDFAVYRIKGAKRFDIVPWSSA